MAEHIYKTVSTLVQCNSKCCVLQRSGRQVVYVMAKHTYMNISQFVQCIYKWYVLQQSDMTGCSVQHGQATIQKYITLNAMQI